MAEGGAFWEETTLPGVEAALRLPVRERGVKNSDWMTLFADFCRILVTPGFRVSRFFSRKLAVSYTLFFMRKIGIRLNYYGYQI